SDGPAGKKRVNVLNTISSISSLRGDPVLTLSNGGSCAEGRFVQPHHRGFGIQFAGAAQVIAAIPDFLPGFPAILDLAQDHRPAAVRTGRLGGAANIIDEALPELGQALARPVQKGVTTDCRPPGAGVGEGIGCRGHKITPLSEDGGSIGDSTGAINRKMPGKFLAGRGTTRPEGEPGNNRETELRWFLGGFSGLVTARLRNSQRQWGRVQ